jgi:hypothetical protein
MEKKHAHDGPQSRSISAGMIIATFIALFFPMPLHSQNFIRIKSKEFFCGGNGFRMLGFNYYPTTAMRGDMTQWDTNEVKNAFAKAASLGATTIRLFVDYGYSTCDTGIADYNDALNDSVETVSFYHPTTSYVSAMKTILDIAARNNCRIIFTLFEAMPGWAFVDSRPLYHTYAMTYLTELVSQFKNDTAIAAWDLLNEPDIIAAKWNVPMPKYFSFFNEAHDTLLSIDSNHLITVGFGKIDTVIAWSDSIKKFCSFISIHYFEDQAVFGIKIDTVHNRLNLAMPIIAEEIGYSSATSNGILCQMTALGGYLDAALNSRKLSGALIWSLNDFSKPKIVRSRGIPDSVAIQKAYGVLDTNLYPKGSDVVVQNFFTGRNNFSKALSFRYSKIGMPPYTDGRFLAVAFVGTMFYLGPDSTLLDSLKFSTITACQQEGRGWYMDAINPSWGQWAGNADSVSVIYHDLPLSTKFLRITLNPNLPILDSNRISIVWRDSLFASVLLHPHAQEKTYTIPLNPYPQRQDLVGSWTGQGVYSRNSNNGAWLKLGSPADLVAAGDLDGDGTDDLIGIWPSQGGVWVKYSQTGSWAKLSSTARHIAAGDMNGDGRVDLVGTWDGQGAYYRNSATDAWVKLGSPATLVTAGDLDGDGTDDLIGIWPSQGGVWVKYSKTGAWAKLSSTAFDIATGDMNGDGRVDFVGTWSGQGTYYLNSVTGAWVKLGSEATQVTSGDLDGDGTDDLIGIWPSQGGVWAKYSKTGAWEKLSSTAIDIATGKLRGGATPDIGSGPVLTNGSTDESAKGPGGARFKPEVEEETTLR